MPRPTPPHVVRAQMAHLAEHVAEGGSVTGWSRTVGMSQTQADRLWQRIRRSLGRQAS